MTAIEPPLTPPPAEILRRLAVSDSGFVFDPVSGNSYSLNTTALATLRLLQQDLVVDAIVAALQKDFAGDPAVLEADVLRFVRELGDYFK